MGTFSARRSLSDKMHLRALLLDAKTCTSPSPLLFFTIFRATPDHTCSRGAPRVRRDADVDCDDGRGIDAMLVSVDEYNRDGIPRRIVAFTLEAWYHDAYRMPLPRLFLFTQNSSKDEFLHEVRRNRFRFKNVIEGKINN